MLNSLHLRRRHHLFPVSIPARLLLASPPPLRSEIAKKVGGEVKGVGRFLERTMDLS